MSNSNTIKTIKRNTRAKNMFCYFTKIKSTADILGISVDIYPTNFTNWVFHVDVEIDIIAEGTDEQIKQFDTLI